jgi:phosphohistidine swiveling domain-containing protein
MNDPLHQPGRPDTFWSTINAEENLAGVVDPLSGTMWIKAVSLSALGAFADMGVVPERDVVFHAGKPDRWATSVICGRYCVNVDFLRRHADLMPGTSGEALERDLFGSARDGIPAHRSFRRYPVIALKAPGTALRVAGRVSRALPESFAWWRRSIAAMDGADVATARAKLAEGHARMTAKLRPHNVGTMVVNGVLEQVRGLCATVGRPELELELTRGLASLEEVGMLNRLWEVSRGRGTVPAFLTDYGFHCPGESAISSVAWREDPSQLDAILETYRGMSEDRSPAAAAAAVGARRREAAGALLAALPRVRRPVAKLLLAYGDTLWALRETGKTSYMHGIDVGRAAVRILARDLAARGHIASADDVVHLTIDELLSGVARDMHEDVAFRRARREEYQSFEVPETWTGTPERLTRDDDAAETNELTGFAASPGTVEGTVRVVTDPCHVEFTDGDVLVCKATDPSWGTLFLMAAAAVIDVGATASHGAIVARELGIPCVINTRIGTQALRDGDRISVDGTRGVVRVLERAARAG